MSEWWRTSKDPRKAGKYRRPSGDEWMDEPGPIAANRKVRLANAAMKRKQKKLVVPDELRASSKLENASDCKSDQDNLRGGSIPSLPTKESK